MKSLCGDGSRLEDSLGLFKPNTLRYHDPLMPTTELQDLTFPLWGLGFALIWRFLVTPILPFVEQEGLLCAIACYKYITWFWFYRSSGLRHFELLMWELLMTMGTLKVGLYFTIWANRETMGTRCGRLWLKHDVFGVKLRRGEAVIASIDWWDLESPEDLWT